MKRNGVAVAGATVSVQVRDPRWRTTTITGTTGAAGTVSLPFTIKSDSSTGWYSITSKATSGTSTATATNSFRVE
ncbi:hypothetical protein D3C83_171170 [compost metagenome]